MKGAFLFVCLLLALALIAAKGDSAALMGITALIFIAMLIGAIRQAIR